MGSFVHLTSSSQHEGLAYRTLAAVAMAEPEAEADPAVLYAGYYGYGLGHYGYGYGLGGYYGYPGYYRGLVGGHSGYPYNYGWTDGPNNGLGPHLLGKREAEEEAAEPEAPKAVVGFAGYKHPAGVFHGLPYTQGWTDGPNNGVGGVPVAAVAPVAAYAHPLHYGYGLPYWG